MACLGNSLFSMAEYSIEMGMRKVPVMIWEGKLKAFLLRWSMGDEVTHQVRKYGSYKQDVGEGKTR